MQVDAILAGLAKSRQRLMRIDGAYTADQAQHRLLIISCMRDPVLRDDAAGFTSYCQNKLLGEDGDIMVDLLEELYEELDLDDRNTTWDEFEMLFLQ